MTMRIFRAIVVTRDARQGATRCEHVHRPRVTGELMPPNNDDWFEAAYPRCIDSLRKYLRRFVGSREEAEDLAHDAFLRVWAAPNFDRGRETQGYLFATARNLALDWNKAHHVAKSDPVDTLPDLPDDGSSVEQDAMTAEEFRTLSKAMSRLPERRRDVLMLRAFFDYSCQEIADQLKISRTTVHRELARAIGTIHAARTLIESERKRNGNAPVISLGRSHEQR